jgi:2-methylcitrate dehydratase PrpD
MYHRSTRFRKLENITINSYNFHITILLSMSIQKKLGKYAFDLSYSEIPQSVLLRAKYSILDTFGVILAGSRSPLSEQLYHFLEVIGGFEESTIFGSEYKASSYLAATLNGAVGHVDELDDGDRFALGHPGITSIPAAFSVGEKIGSNGKEVLLGVILGYEVFSRIARSINPSHRQRGFHTTATCGTFGAAVASGKVLGLTDEQLISSLGIAGIQAAGLGSGSGNSMLKPLGVGKSSGNGVLSASLAKLNIPTSSTIIDGKRGFIKAFSDKYGEEKILHDLGKGFKLMDSYIKFHASCRHTHPTIDAVLNIKSNNDLDLKKISSILVKTYDAAAHLGEDNTPYHPPSPHAAKFSIPYVVAISLHDGVVSEDSFSWEKINDSEILKIADKVEVIEEFELSKLTPMKRGSIVEIKTKDSNTFSSTIDNPVGEPENLDYGKIEEKFNRLSKKVITEHRSKEILNRILNFEKISDIRDLGELLLLEGGVN